jgi:hypothetical protein
MPIFEMRICQIDGVQLEGIVDISALVSACVANHSLKNSYLVLSKFLILLQYYRLGNRKNARENILLFHS